jgi:hypothetical protein
MFSLHSLFTSKFCRHHSHWWRHCHRQRSTNHWSILLSFLLFWHILMYMVFRWMVPCYCVQHNLWLLEKVGWCAETYICQRFRMDILVTWPPLEIKFDIWSKNCHRNWKIIISGAQPYPQYLQWYVWRSMSMYISADCVFRSYKDALEAGLFTAKPYDVFDKDVCAVGFSCPWPYHSLSMLTCTSLAISQHYFSKLGRHDQHTGRPDISCWYPFLHLKLVQTTTFISFTLILHYIGANSWLRGLCGCV